MAELSDSAAPLARLPPPGKLPGLASGGSVAPDAQQNDSSALHVTAALTGKALGRGSMSTGTQPVAAAATMDAAAAQSSLAGHERAPFDSSSVIKVQFLVPPGGTVPLTMPPQCP